jgi:zinc protease
MRTHSGVTFRASIARLHALAGILVAAAVLVGAVGQAAAQVKDWPSEAPPRPLPARDVKFPPYEIRTLPNGMQVMVVLHHEQPVVSMRMLIRAGSAHDPKGKTGVAALTAALLDQGTKTRTAAQIADTIDSIGGGLGTGAGSDLSFANVVVMKDSFDLGLELLSDVVRHPAFHQEEIDRQRQQALSGLKVSFEDPDYVASLVFDRLVYGFHPYGLPNSGTPESLQAITADDLHAFHAKYFVPNNTIFAIVGDVTGPEAFAAAERVFGAWPKRAIQPPPVMEPPLPTRRVVVINKPDAVQTEVRVGHLGIARRHPDYLATDLAIKILGGEGSNRLHRVLRSERGLTYGAEADMQALKQAGDFAAETDTRTETTAEALRLIVDEFLRLQRERVSERELADAQAYLAGSFPLTIETPDAIAAQVLNALFYELPLSDLETYRERVNAITPDDIQRVARQYLKPDRLSVVLVGDAARFVDQLRGVGFDQYEQINLSDLDLTAADFRRTAQPVAASPASQSAAPRQP